MNIYHPHRIFRTLSSLLPYNLLLAYSRLWHSLSQMSVDSSFHSDSAFLKIYSKSTGLFGHKKSENNNRTLKGNVSANELRTGVILAEDKNILIKQKMPVHNRPHGAAILLTSYKLNNMCNAKNFAYPYGQRTKINYEESISQYIVFVKLKYLYIVFSADCRKKGTLFVFIIERTS